MRLTRHLFLLLPMGEKMRREAGIVVCTLLHTESYIETNVDDAVFVGRSFFVFSSFCFVFRRMLSLYD